MVDQPTPDRIMQTGLGFWGSKVLLSAVEIGLFTELAKQPDDLQGLQRRLELHPRSARDFLDALVAMKFLHREKGVYRNTDETDLYLDRAKPSYLGGMLEMASRRLFGFWSHLTEALRTGQPQCETKGGGTSFFETLYSSEERLEGFLSAMTGLSSPANHAIATRFDWKTYDSYVDVGTAQGDLAVQVGKVNGHLKGIGFDLPVVEPIFNEYVRQHDLTDRLRFQPGDFFRDPLPPGDVIMMGHILHDWNLDEKKTLIEKAYEALPGGGAMIVYESIIDDERRENVFGLLMSINMLIETSGGFDYTGADCSRWMREAGFSQTRVEHLVGPDSMVIGIK